MSPLFQLPRSIVAEHAGNDFFGHSEIGGAQLLDAERKVDVPFSGRQIQARPMFQVAPFSSQGFFCLLGDVN